MNAEHEIDITRYTTAELLEMLLISLQSEPVTDAAEIERVAHVVAHARQRIAAAAAAGQ